MVECVPECGLSAFAVGKVAQSALSCRGSGEAHREAGGDEATITREVGLRCRVWKTEALTTRHLRSGIRPGQLLQAMHL